MRGVSKRRDSDDYGDHGNPSLRRNSELQFPVQYSGASNMSSWPSAHIRQNTVVMQERLYAGLTELPARGQDFGDPQINVASNALRHSQCWLS